MGLLFLRFTVAGTVMFLTFSLSYAHVILAFRGWLIVAISALFSAAMATGFLTPVISALIFVSGILFLVLAPREMSFFFVIYLIALSFAIILLGPGAYSIDARLFGRREIKM